MEINIPFFSYYNLTILLELNKRLWFWIVNVVNLEYFFIFIVFKEFTSIVELGEAWCKIKGRKISFRVLFDFVKKEVETPLSFRCEKLGWFLYLLVLSWGVWTEVFPWICIIVVITLFSVGLRGFDFRICKNEFVLLFKIFQWIKVIFSGFWFVLVVWRVEVPD